MGSFVGRGNQYIQMVKVLYSKLPTISKQIPTSHTISFSDNYNFKKNCHNVIYRLILFHFLVLCMVTGENILHYSFVDFSFSVVYFVFFISAI